MMRAGLWTAFAFTAIDFVCMVYKLIVNDDKPAKRIASIVVALLAAWATLAVWGAL